MTKIVPEEKAKQGRSGRQMLVVLIAAMLLVLVAWAGVEIWGEHIASQGTDAPAAVSQ